MTVARVSNFGGQAFSNSTVTSWTDTAGTGANCAFVTIAWVSIGGGGPTIIQSPNSDPDVGWGGVPMTLVATGATTTDTGFGYFATSIYRLTTADGLLTGPQTVQVYFSNASYGVVNSTTYSGVDQTTPANGLQNDSAASGRTTSGVTITTGAAGDLTLDCMLCGNGGATDPGALSNNGTLIDSDFPLGLWRTGSQERAGAGSVAMTWSWSTSGGVAQTGCNIKSVAGSGTSGTLAKTNANDTLVAAGKQTHKGTLARTNANDTLFAGGTRSAALTLPLVDEFGANVSTTAFRWSWFDQSTVNTLLAPASSGVGVTNSSGVASITVTTGLAAGAVGTILLSTSAGSPAVNNRASCFPVTLT